MKTLFLRYLICKQISVKYFFMIQHFHTTNSSTTSYILAIVFALDMLNWFEKMGVKYPKYPDILKRISWVHSIFLKWD